MDIIAKISACIDYQCLYALEKEFNKVGLSIRCTTNKKMIICKLKDGKPFADNIIDDYIFVGSLDHATKELTDRTADKICDFVNNASGEADSPKNIAKVWRNGLRMYEQSIVIENEDIASMTEEMSLNEEFDKGNIVI